MGMGGNGKPPQWEWELLAQINSHKFFAAFNSLSY